MPRRSLYLAACLAGSALAQQPRARLEGQCLDARLRPVANCAITVTAEGEVLAKTSSDATGFFVAGGLPHTRLVVGARDGADVGATAVDLGGESCAFAHVSLYPARTLRGSVKQADGTPVAGAWVMAAPSDCAELAIIDACSLTGADGRYQLKDVLPGPVTVRVWAPGYELFEGAAEGSVDAALDCILGGEPRRSVRLQWQGPPGELPGLRVRCAARNIGDDLPVLLPPPLRNPRADAQGGFMLPAWPSFVHLFARCELPDGRLLGPIDHEVHSWGWQLAFDPRPDPARSLTGVIVDADDRPIAGKHLLCRPLDEVEAEVGTVLGVSGPEGAFTLPALFETGRKFALRMVEPDLAVVHEPSRASSRSWYVAVHEPGRLHHVPVAATLPLQMLVVDAAGAPVRGVDAEVRTATANGRGPRTAQDGIVLGTGTSDAIGRIELYGIDLTGVKQLQVTLTSLQGAAECSHQLAGAVADLGSIALGPACQLAGTVTGPDGKPVVGARVRVDQRLVLTDRAGRFAVGGLRNGRHVVVVGRRVGAWLASQSVPVQPGVPSSVAIAIR